MKKSISIQQQIVLFILLTYAFSWVAFWIGHRTNILPLIILGVWGPSIISLCLTAFLYGKQGLKKLLGRFQRYHIKWYWWLALLFLPALIHFTGRSIWQIFYAGELDPFFRPLPYLSSAIIPSFLIAGLGEELGWRGFVLPRLQRHYRPITATLMMALIHMFWHLPTYWLGQGIHNVPLVYILCFLFPWTIIFNWLYNRSGGSLIFAVGFHAISNASLSIVRFMPLDSQVPITPDLITRLTLPAPLGGPYLAVCAVYAMVALLVLLFGKFDRVNTDIP